MDTVNAQGEAAGVYASKGKPVFPCNRDKTPRISRGFKNASKDLMQIREWWAKWPDASIGMPTGAASELWVLDVDLPDGPASLEALEAEHGKIPATLTQQTGGGGKQFFFILPEGRKVKNSTSKIGPGLDIRGEGGYVILPPSGHPSGGQYQWLNPKQLPVAAPEWLLELVCERPEQPPENKAAPASFPKVANCTFAGTTPYGRKALEDEAAKVASASNGCRNDTLNQAAFAVGALVAGGEVDRAEAEAELYAAAQVAGLESDPGCGPKGVRDTIASGMKAGEKKPRQAPEPMKGKSPEAAPGLGSGLLGEDWRPEVKPWPILKREALPGIVGEFVDLATAKSEADPAAILATFLTRFGVEVFGYEPGKGPFLHVGDARHYPRLNVAIVGATSTAKKGTSACTAPGFLDTF